MTFLFFLVAILLVLGSLANNGHEPRTSPRTKQLQALAAAGLTDKLVAHFIIDLARNPALTSPVLVDRLSTIKGVDSTRVTAWINAVTPFI